MRVLSRGGALPRGASRRASVQIVGFEPFAASIQRVAERRNSQPRIAATIGSPYGKARPVSGRELPIHNADRRASQRSTAAFSLSPETAF